MNENTTPRGNFLYTSPVLAPNSSPYGRTSSGSNVSNQQTQMPLSPFHLQSSECFQSEAHPIVKTEASTSHHAQKFHYPLLRGHQAVNQQQGCESSSEVEAIKAKIIAHPQYSNLLEAYMDCQKVSLQKKTKVNIKRIHYSNSAYKTQKFNSLPFSLVNVQVGAPPEVVARLAAARQEFESRQRSAVTSRDTSKDPELDQFMVIFFLGGRGKKTLKLYATSLN